MRDWIQREIIALICAVVVVLLVLLPRNASALVALTAALIVPVAVFLARPVATVLPSRRARLTELAVLSPALLALVASLFAESLPVALWGIRGQHTGAWMWIALAAVFIAFVERSRTGDLVRGARAIAITGAALGSTAFFTRHALVNKYPWLLSFGLTDSAPGLVESSISLAQVLLVAVGAAGLWGLSTRDKGQRYGAAAAFALIAGGLWVTETWTAYLAVVAASALLLILRTARLRIPRLDHRTVPAVAVALALSLLAATWAVGSIDPTSSAFEVWNARLSSRPVIWNAAVVAIPNHLALGRGADHFSMWTTWDSVPGRSMEQYSTDDPHSILLNWLLMAGIPGVALLLLALWAQVASFTRALDKARWRMSFVALAVGLVAWLLLTLTAWTGPLAGLFAAILAGSTLGEVEVAEHRSASEAEDVSPIRGGIAALFAIPYLPAALALVIVSTALFTGVKTISAEMIWAGALRSRTEVPLERSVALAQMSKDPSYAADAAKGYHRRIVETRDPAVAGEALATVGPLLDRSSAWSVGCALQRITLTADSALLKAGATADDVVEAVSAARRSAPTSGLWDYVGAVQLTSLGRTQEARLHAERALRSPLPEPVRDWCEGLVAQ